MPYFYELTGTLVNQLTILLAQINPTVGAIAANTEKIVEIIQAQQETHDLILFPELAITGYPPEDLLLRNDLYQQVEEALAIIRRIVTTCYVVIGHPRQVRNKYFNAASVFYDHKLVAIYHKQHLPNYSVFDEARYFTPGVTKPCIISIKGYKFGLCICEDIWHPKPIKQLVAAKIDALLCINASPFHYCKLQMRKTLLATHTKLGFAIIYVNQVGGQDELLFDGQSLVFDAQGNLCARSKAFQEQLQSICFASPSTIRGEITPLLDETQLIYAALVCGTRDYVEKNNFPGVLLGLSGGIDSALTLAIAVDALGSDRVQAVLLPSRYTADMSIIDAQQLATNLNVASNIISIEPTFQAVLASLDPILRQSAPDVTQENIQARIRALLLMALANKTGNMVLVTSNKSETAVGYATLYGDMAGGLAILKDVYKTQVYDLAHYRNGLSPVIPSRIITRAPSAELAANQTDADSLPEYSILDPIIKNYMEYNKTAEEIIRAGYSASDVYKVINLIKRNEYKRYQAAPGIKISPRAFGKDWRLPITSGFKD